MNLIDDDSPDLISLRNPWYAGPSTICPRKDVSSCHPITELIARSVSI